MGEKYDNRPSGNGEVFTPRDKQSTFLRLREILSQFTLEDALKLETYDRQYRALEKLFNSLGNGELFLKLVLVNALLSYQLPMKGEDYWETFAEFFSKGKDLTGFEEFLKLYNNRFLSGKLKRLKKVLKSVEGLSPEKLDHFCKNPEGLLKYLSESLKQPPNAKTLVFAVKMFLYACRIAGKETAVAPFEMEIPLDVRLKRIADDYKFWKGLAREVGIPPLHLDVIVWTTMGGNKKFFQSIEDKELREKLLRLKKVLSDLTC